jgi:hypothetical protein
VKIASTAIALLLVACSGDAPSGTLPSAFASAAPLPSIVDFPDETPKPPPGPGPAPSSESPDMRERVVLGLFEGGGPIDDMPEVTTDDGGPMDPHLRDTIASAGVSSTIRVTPIEASAGLPVEVISRIVRQSVPRVRRCYDEGHGRNPNLSGRLTMKFVIGATGSVYEPSFTGDLPDLTVATCTRNVLASLTFPKPEGKAPVTASFSFIMIPPS